MERDTLPWFQPPNEEEQHTTGGNNNNGDGFITGDECLASFRSMLEIEGYMNSMPTHNEQVVPNFQIQSQQQKNFVSPSDPNNKDMSSNVSEVDKWGSLSIPYFTSTCLKEFDQKKEKEVKADVDGGLNCESKKGVDIGGNGGRNDDEDEKGVGEVDRKGKKKENPSKSLLAERGRRKKLGDKMRNLRSIVPIISKMDKASILGDASDYVNELRQKINDLQTELESISLGSSLTPTTSSPRHQSTKVKAREMEDGTINIHIFCAYKSGALISIMKAFDILGLDIHQATISSSNGFTIDVYKDEQCMEGQKVNLELIKEVLVNAVDYHE